MSTRTNSQMNPQNINQIFKQYSKAYRRKYPQTTIPERKVLHSIEICRTEDLGSRIFQCNTCNQEITLYNSCRNRHCPQCQNMKKEMWILKRKQEVLPFTYFHIVFTLPNEMNIIAHKNKRTIYNLLFQTCKQTLLLVSADEKYFGANIGFFAILHTWGQKINMHNHLHCVVPGGGFSQKKQKWIHAPNNYLVPAQVLRKRFRSIFLCELKNLFYSGKLYLSGTQYENPKKFQNMIDSFFSREWVVYLKKSFKGKDSVIEYLARYTHKIAITNHRIVSLENDIVTYRYRDYKDENKVKNISVHVLLFMRRFLLHVLPYRFVRIRYFGILSHRNKKKTIQACRDFYNMEEPREQSSLQWQALYLKLTGKDCTKCSNCRTGILILKEIIPPKRYRAPPVLSYVEMAY